MKPETYAVVLAGGRGERFWPLSTSKTPKQLLALVDEHPMITAAVDRLDSPLYSGSESDSGSVQFDQLLVPGF